jgi:hypothetical protein
LVFFTNELGALVLYNAACPEVMQHYTEKELKTGENQVTRGELNKSKDPTNANMPKIQNHTVQR